MPVHSIAEWTASIPATLTPRSAMVYVDTALLDAKEATDAIIARYKGGTLPPPPWPQHPELVTAVEAMEGGKILLKKAIEIGHGDDTYEKTSTRALPLLTAGQHLYREISRMQGNDKRGEITAANLPRLIPAALANITKTKLGGVLVVGLVLYALDQWGNE